MDVILHDDNLYENAFYVELFQEDAMGSKFSFRILCWCAMDILDILQDDVPSFLLERLYGIVKSVMTGGPIREGLVGCCDRSGMWNHKLPLI